MPRKGQFTLTGKQLMFSTGSVLLSVEHYMQHPLIRKSQAMDKIAGCDQPI
jgi:hypothetical protein